MILSHLHKFIFIKGVKVAGTSVEVSLSQVCGPEDIVTPITPADEKYRLGTPGEPRNYASHLYPRPFRPKVERSFVRFVRAASDWQLGSVPFPRSRFFNHMDLRTVLKHVPEAAGYTVLCVERSPYAKAMSLANWAANTAQYVRGRALPQGTERLTSGLDQVLANGGIRRVLNVERYRRPDGEIDVTAWKTETLESDMKKFLSSRGLEYVPLVNAKSGARSDRLDPAEILRPDQIASINEIFAEEFELFGWPMIR